MDALSATLFEVHGNFVLLLKNNVGI